MSEGCCKFQNTGLNTIGGFVETRTVLPYIRHRNMVKTLCYSRGYNCCNNKLEQNLLSFVFMFNAWLKFVGILETLPQTLNEQLRSENSTIEVCRMDLSAYRKGQTICSSSLRGGSIQNPFINYWPFQGSISIVVLRCCPYISLSVICQRCGCSCPFCFLLRW